MTIINYRKSESKKNILTYSGIEMNPLHPEADELEIRDIAHSLSMIARANGHFHSMHSVAQHSLECAREAEARGLDTDMILFCLLHDGAEAYLGDFVSPVKHQIKEYNDAEEELLTMIYRKFVGKIPTKEQKEVVKEIDHTLLYYEFEELMGRPISSDPPKALSSSPDFSERPWKEVEKAFYERYDMLQKKRFEKIRGIWFDVDDTLYSQHDSFWDACRKTFGDCWGISSKDLFGAYFNTYNKKGGKEAGQGKTHSLSPSMLQQIRIKTAFETFGVTITEEEAERFQECYLYNQVHRELSDTIRDMFDGCEGKVNLGILSNGDSDYQRKKVEVLGLSRWIRPEHILVSGDVKIDKPDRKIFDLAAERAGLQPEEMLYVGDSAYNDIWGANQAGWMSVWMNRNNKAVTEKDPKPDYTVYTEEELKNLILSCASSSQ